MRLVGILAVCAAAATALWAVTARGAADEAPLQVAEHVDLERYLGTWYEIASFPTRFQRGCSATTATYALRGDGDIEVVNRCRKGGLTGPVTEARGKAWVVDTQTNARLKVQFFWPFRGDYWILEVGPEYDYAVVGNPTRQYLWILCRTPRMDEALYESLLERLERDFRYDVDRLRLTAQPAS